MLRSVFAILFIATAFCFGIGDFFAGVASRRVPVITVAFLCQLTAALLMTALLLLQGMPLHLMQWWLGIPAGLSVALALILYFRALQRCPMGKTAAVTGVFSAIIPFAVGLAWGHRPSLLAIAGGILAVGAIPRLFRGEKRPVHSLPGRSGMIDAAIAGSLFGICMILLALSGEGRAVGTVCISAWSSLLPLSFLWWRSRGISLPRIPWGGRLCILAAGITQGSALVFYSLGVQKGLFSVMAVAGAVSPIPTMLMAWVVLQEKPTLPQIAWVGVAVGGVALLLAG